MKILGLLRADESSERGDPPSAELMERVGTFMEEVAKAGVLQAADGLLPSSAGKRMKYENGTLTITDGPFTESKELVASYALYDVPTWDDAVDWTARFLEVIGGGECELRPIATFEDFGLDAVPAGVMEREEATRAEMEKNR